MSWPDMMTPWETGHAPPDPLRVSILGGGDAARGFGLLCVAACICPACGVSWANPAFTCDCTNAIRANEANTTARGNRP